jgi:hypothetical protein
VIALMLLIGVASAAAGEEGEGADLKAVLCQGLADLGLQKENPDLCALTNAPCVRLEQKPGINPYEVIGLTAR